MRSQKEEIPQAAPKPNETTYGILKDIMKLFFPTMVTRISQQPYFILLLIARNFGSTDKLAAVGMGCTILSLYVIWLIGVTAPNTTLTAQAHGKGDLRLCGLYLQRTLLVGAFASVPVALVMFKSKAILMSLGQDPKVVEHTTEFLYLAGPGVFLDMIQYVYSQWLSQFKLQHVPMLTSVCSCLVFAPLVYLLAVQ